MKEWTFENDPQRVECLHLGGAELRAGDSVRLHPRAGGDIFDVALAGRSAVVQAIEQDFEGRVHVAVTLDDDPGRDLGLIRQPGHRFFFSPEEIEPVAGTTSADSDTATTAEPPQTARILVAGIGNIFLGDDAFGVEVAARLLARSWPEEVHVEDFGIRGLDLAYALGDGYTAAILVDAVPRGGPPGMLYLIEANETSAEAETLDMHGLDPVKVLRLARHLGSRLPRVLVVGCEPQLAAAGEEPAAELSPPVRAAVGAAVEMVASLVAKLLAGEPLSFSP
jgi:hydrogenase maturation protease